MDIDLLAKMVKEVVMDHDVVTLPGVGSFVAELVPATFADRGYTILPPYRRREKDHRLPGPRPPEGHHGESFLLCGR